MSITEQKELAEKLRQHFLSFPDLAVKGGAFSLDGLAAKGESMSLQMNPGHEISRSISGRRTMSQPFTIYYRSAASGENEAKSSMMGALNAIGVWLEEQERLPELGTGIHATKLEQTALASIVEQDNVVVAYMATFNLQYNIRP